jgi:S-(hydroxymethyl)glutathione dehydrogenase/alcohol dehydrogenase
VRGIVYTGEKAELTDELGLRAPGPIEVVVRTAAAGVCHSDLSVVDGTIPWPSPSVLGHEGAGVVEEVGSAVTMVRPGDHVVVSTLASCGMCRWCNTGRPTWCRRTMGNVTQPFTFRGEPAYNFAATSSFAELTVVQQVQAVPISKDVPLQSACLIACGVLTGVGAVLNRAKVSPGQTAAVFGVGGVGLNVIQGLRLAGASRIVAVDAVAAKEDLARAFGATDFVDASQVDAVEAIRGMLPTGGGDGAMPTAGVDWSFECVGNEKVLASALEVLDWGGTCVAVGVPAQTAQVPVRVTHLTHVDRGLLGSRYGSARPHHDIPLLVGLYLDGRLMLDELVSRTEPLEGFDAVVADMHDGKLARGVLTF